VGPTPREEMQGQMPGRLSEDPQGSRTGKEREDRSDATTAPRLSTACSWWNLGEPRKDPS
jgi:hypothetical protein